MDRTVLGMEDGMPGFQCGRSLDKLSLKARDLPELSFTDVRVVSIAVNSQAAVTAVLEQARADLIGLRL